MFVHPMASVVLPDSVVVFGAIWAFPIKIASHSGRLSKHFRHKTLFFRERSDVLVSAMFSLSGKAMGAEASISRWFYSHQFMHFLSFSLKKKSLILTTAEHYLKF